jgi:2-amino-4-hydroxy-6-hydroxymethyldihydropteridine diphosphokinase
MKYFLCLGSNVGDRSKNLEKALFLIEKKGSKIIKKSSVYETEPVDSPPQPSFFNQVVEISSKLDPMGLLKVIKKIEQQMGRKSTTQNEPRIIDIDILLAEKAVIRTEKLDIPHPRMEKRNFVLIPFNEISPKTVHPLLNASIEDLRKKSKDHSAVRKIKESDL